MAVLHERTPKYEYQTCAWVRSTNGETGMEVEPAAPTALYPHTVQLSSTAAGQAGEDSGIHRQRGPSDVLLP